MEAFLLALCEGNPPVTSKWASDMGFEVFFGVQMNKLYNKQSKCWWFETPRCSVDVTIMCELWHVCIFIGRTLRYLYVWGRWVGNVLLDISLAVEHFNVDANSSLWKDILKAGMFVW